MLNSHRWPSFSALAFASIAFAAPLYAQEMASAQDVTVEKIYREGSSWIGRYVQVKGKVARWEKGNSFFLEDNFGAGIEVYVNGALPKRDLEVVVNGYVAVDPANNPYLQAKDVLPPPPPPSLTQADADTDGVPDAKDECPRTKPGVRIDAVGCAQPWYQTLPVSPTLLVVGTGLLFVGLGIYLAVGRKGQGDPSAVASLGAGHGSQEGNTSVDEGKTIRIARPDESQGTLQILPGRLEICSGPDAGRVADIRFVRDRTVGGPVPEVTFGRHGQASPTHVVLKSPTVSRLHAKFRYDGGRWHVINYSETNPVLLNKQAIPSTDSPVLVADQDIIEMGEVGFRFHV